MHYTKELLETLVKSSLSTSEVVRKLGKKPTGNSHRAISKKIKDWQIDTSHFLGQAINKSKTKPWQEVLVLKQKNHRENRVILRRALIESGRVYECENPSCTIKNKWLNNNISLHIDHINGQWRDNRPQNLRFLCPNCHSQTPNYCNPKNSRDLQTNNRGLTERYEQGRSNQTTERALGKKVPHINARKVERPSKEELQKLVWTRPTIHIAKDFGVSDKAIEKWCKAYGIEKPPRGYWAKKKHST